LEAQGLPQEFASKIHGSNKSYRTFPRLTSENRLVVLGLFEKATWEIICLPTGLVTNNPPEKMILRIYMLDVKYQFASLFLINRFDSVSLWSKAARAQAREYILCLFCLRPALTSKRLNVKFLQFHSVKEFDQVKKSLHISTSISTDTYIH
jgi:hypothetical protein